MASLKVYSLENQEVGTVDLHDELAQAPLNPFIIKDTVVAYRNEQRQGTHKTKGRSEVAGSRKKLFRQKGTGNARMGSQQSPVRRHGGIVFGPTPRSYANNLNKKVKKKALISVISEKIRNGQLLIVDSLKLEDHKTKKFLALLEKMNLNKALFVFSEQDSNFELASRNVQSVKSVHSSGLNIYDALKYTHLVMTKDALLDVEGRLLK